MTRGSIIGTAGHIDHGKTALVKMLTGVDTDRLKEEKERGISIELGFASLTTPGGRRAGIVDVPGHERFIKHMLAGAGGIDLVLLIIAADEGVMPQTREHFDIIRLLGITEGIVVLTKTDLVDAEWLALVRADVARFIADTPLAGSPIAEVSSTTGTGRDALLALIDEKLSAVHPLDRGDLLRLPVDRVFVMEGFGTVVTGTLWGGTVGVGDEVTVLPKGLRTRVRSVQVHNEKVTRAEPGHRVAVALHGLAKEEVERGDWVAGAGPIAASSMLDVRLSLLAGAPRALRTNARVRFHHGAMERLGRIVLLEGDELPPGAASFAQVRLESPAVALRGDRFVLRRYSPPQTIGGGIVLDPNAGKRRRGDARALEALRVLERGDPAAQVAQAVLARGAEGIASRDLPRALGGLDAPAVAAAAEALVASGTVRRIGEGLLVHKEAFASAASLVHAELERSQREHRLRWGMAKGELKSRLAPRIPAPVFDALLAEETGAGRLHARGDRVRTGGAEAPLAPEGERLRERVETLLLAQPFAPPSPKEMLAAGSAPVPGSTKRASGSPAQAPGSTAGRGGEAPALTADDLTEMLQHLVFEGRAVRVMTDLYYHAGAIRRVEDAVREFFRKKEELTVGEFKDLLGISRKHAVPLLEHLDRTGVTRRRGDTRVAGTPPA